MASTAPALPNANELAAIAAAAQLYSVPLPVSLAVAAQESGFAQYDASGNVLTSTDGAASKGIYQLTAGTASDMGVDASDPAQNIVGGNKYLGSLIKLYGGNVATALEAYNAGPTAVAQNTAGAQQAAAKYVPSVEALAQAYAGASSPASAAGGASAFSSSGLSWNTFTEALSESNSSTPAGIAPAVAGIAGTANAAVGKAAGAATSTVVSAVFNQLTAVGFTEKIVQFAVILALLFGGFAIIRPAGAAA